MVIHPEIKLAKGWMWGGYFWHLDPIVITIRFQVEGTDESIYEELVPDGIQKAMARISDILTSLKGRWPHAHIEAKEAYWDLFGSRWMDPASFPATCGSGSLPD